jgi:hypothetical protein
MRDGSPAVDQPKPKKAKTRRFIVDSDDEIVSVDRPTTAGTRKGPVARPNHEQIPNASKPMPDLLSLKVANQAAADKNEACR